MAGRKRRGLWRDNPQLSDRPAFQTGNEVTTVHGARSAARWQPLADQLAERLVEVAPWTAGQAHTLTVAAWSRAEAQSCLLAAYLDEHGLLDDEGNPRSAVTQYERVETRAANLRRELGLTPLALAKLLQALASVADSHGVADGLEAVRAAGRQITQAHARSEDDR